jgi:hypothetical protein
MKRLDIAAILLSVLIGAFGLVYSLGSPPAGSVVIQTPFGSYRYNLDIDRTVKVRGLLGDYWIEIKAGKVRAKEANCPERICIQRGWANRSGDSIICIPNQIIIRLESGEQKEDAITG